MTATSTIGIKLSLDGASQTEASLRRVGGSMDQLSTSAASVRQAMGGLAGALAGALSVREFVQAADAVTQLQNNLRLATGSAQAAGVAYQQLFDIAQRSRTNFAELGNTFASITRATESLGLSQRQVLALTETIGNAITVSGASAQASQAALVQLGQGLASGVLRGEELNSILEQTPRLAKALADGLGVSTGALRKLGEEGKLTAEAVVGALQSQQAALASEVQTSVVTVGQAFQQLKNAALVVAGDFDAASGSTGALVTGMQAVATTIGDLRVAFRGVSQSESDFSAFGEGVAATIRTIVLGASTAVAILQNLGKAGAGLAAAGVQLATGGGFAGARAVLDAMSEDIAANTKRWKEQGIAILESAGAAKAASEINERASARLARQGGGDSAKPLDFSRVVGGANSAKAAIKELGDEFASQREAAKGWADAWGDFAKIQRDVEASSDGLSKAQARLVEYLSSTAYTNASEEMRQLALDKAYAAIEAENLSTAIKAENEAIRAAIGAWADLVEVQQGNAQTAQQALAAQLAENETIGASVMALAELEAAKLLDAAASKERLAVLADEIDWSGDLGRAYQAEAKALRELAAAKTAGAAKQVAADTAKAAADEWQRASQQIEQSLTDALMRGFESGKGFADVLRDTVANMFKTMVLRPVISAVVSPLAGAITGSLGLSSAANAATSAGGSLLGTAATSAGTSALFGGASLSALGSAFGQGFMATLGGSTISGGTAAGLLAGGAAPGTGLAGTLGAAAPYALAAAAVLAALGAFRTTKTVGGGLTGTLGEGDIRAYDLRRKSGYLFGGPDYSIADRGVSEQSAALQAAFLSSRSAMAQTADAFDLGADAIRNFTTAIGSELIHPDTGGLGLKLDGLNPEQVQAKVQAALAAANDAMAAELLGIKTTAVETIKRTVTEVVGSGDDREWINREVSEQITTTATALRRDLVPWMQRIADASGPTAATLQTIAEYPAKLLEVAGTSRDALVQAFAQGLVTGDATTAGQTVANTLVASVEQAMLNNASGQIFDIVNRGIVTPMLDALLTGQTLTEALSQATIDATVAKATAAAQALGAVFNDPAFAAAMDQLRSSVGSALGTAGGALGFAAQYQQPTAAVAATASAGADSLGSAVGQLAQRFDGATNTLLGNQQDLQDQLLRAQGRTAEANTLARQRELAAYSDLAPEQQAHLAALYDQNQALRDQISTIEAANLVAEQRAGLERQLLEATGNTAALRALDLAALDESNRALQQRIWALQDEAAATNALQSQMASARDALQGVVSLSAQQTDGLLGALQKRFDADRKALETNRAAAASLVQEVSGVFDALKTNVRDLFAEVDSTRQYQAAQGRAFIASALAGARAGGGLPSAAELSDAISAARGGLDAQLFASQAEADFARLVLANELRDLQDISGSQLTEAERMLSVAESQLTALDGQLDAYREQIDVMRGVEQYTGTAAELLTRLLAAMEAERNLRTAVGASNLMGAGQASYSVGAQAGLTGAGQYFTQADALAAAAPFATGNANDALALYGAAQQSGFSLGQLEKIYGLGAGTLEDEVRKIEDAFGLKLPRFDVGTNYVPRDMLAVVHQGEAIVPAAYNPAVNPGLGGGNTELVAEIRALRQQNERLEARLASIETHQRRTADTLENVTEGGANMRTVAA